MREGVTTRLAKAAFRFSRHTPIFLSRINQINARKPHCRGMPRKAAGQIGWNSTEGSIENAEAKIDTDTQDPETFFMNRLSRRQWLRFGVISPAAK